ncbi:SLC13 family permease [Paracoccus sp. p3-h83]|uniref:SLC13 family permease n=1 Tax=Paracoccus sp. p3-h83 TaxID=3342805 RepID=UPI0035BA62B1
MTTDQALLFGLFGAILVLMIWGRWRYDLVALAGLVAAVLLGLVPAAQAFNGFGHPAVMTVALILVVTAGLQRSGAVALLAKHLGRPDRSLPLHLAVFGGVGAFMSGFMNNVAALAILMPIDRRVAEKAGRAAGLTLMALAFTTILGGMATLIGTPPNLIVSTFRQEALGTPYRMFDFLPVGGLVALAGVVFIALIGWRLVPQRAGNAIGAETRIRDYVTDLIVTEKSPLVGQTVRDVHDGTEKADVHIFAVVRDGKRLHGWMGAPAIQPGDHLLIEASPAALEEFRAAQKLAFPDGTNQSGGVRPEGGGQVLIEMLVPETARIVGKTSHGAGLAFRYDAVLMGILRRGQTIRDNVRRTRIEPGDMLLMLVPESRRDAVVDGLGVIALDGGGAEVIKESRIWIALGLFIGAIVAASFGITSMAVALAAVVIGYVLAGVLSIEELYDHVDWPVIVLLGAMIPLGMALDSTGTSGLIAGGLAAMTSGLPAWVALVALMVATMFLSDVLNNNATTIIAAPVSIRLAEQLGVNPDPFLMGVAVAASCAFLTPIGHQNNTLVLGPGGYRFGDYWRMGLPLEIIVLAVGVPALLTFWPL